MARSIFDVWLIQLLPQWQSFFEYRKVCGHKTLILLLAPQCSTPRLGRRLEGQRQVADDIVLWFWPVIKATLHHRPDRRQKTICSETKFDASTNWIFHSNVPRSHFPFLLFGTFEGSAEATNKCCRPPTSVVCRLRNMGGIRMFGGRFWEACRGAQHRLTKFLFEISCGV